MKQIKMKFEEYKEMLKVRDLYRTCINCQQVDKYKGVLLCNFNGFPLFDVSKQSCIHYRQREKK